MITADSLLIQQSSAGKIATSMDLGRFIQHRYTWNLIKLFESETKIF